jgi:transposase-like protein DUF772
MTDSSIVTQLALLPDSLWPPKKAEKPGDLYSWAQQRTTLPPFVAACPIAQRYLDLLGPLHWCDFPERNLARNWGQATIPFRALAAAHLIKLEEGLSSLRELRRFLVEHPSLIWLLGFPRVPAPNTACGFNAAQSLPTQRHLTDLLRTLPNEALQFLLADSVQLIWAELTRLQVERPACVSLDTKHILAWVKENNPKAYVRNRYCKDQQPAGDPDCRLGCKRRHNRQVSMPTPTRNPLPAQTLSIGEYYWGYGSGVVVMKVPEWGEFVLAELTQPFDQGDVSYFFPLMAQTEARLGQKPRFGAFDAAFDAWYVYAYFYNENNPAGGFAAVPFSEKGGYKAKGRHFTAEGLPVCAAGLPMPLHFTFTDRTTCLVEHERGKYVCSLRFPETIARRCPIHHQQWSRGGCVVMMPTSIGARLRYTLDRESEAYKEVYRQRTADERINSQAVALGIERPHLRNGAAITNQNTLIYLLINLHFLQRVRQQQHERD